MIRIVSNGLQGGTHVFADDGTELRGITSVVWTIKGDEHGAARATAVLTFDDVAVEVKGERVS